MINWRFFFTGMLLLVGTLACTTFRAPGTPAPFPSEEYATPTDRPTLTPFQTATATPSSTPTLEPSQTPLPTETPAETSTPTFEPAETPLPTDTPTRTRTPSRLPTQDKEE